MLTATTAGLGLAVLGIAICGRLLIAGGIAPLGLGFNVKEKIFVAIAWIPKGTVQVMEYTSRMHKECYFFLYFK